jgi:hypothetical protein
VRFDEEGYIIWGDDPLPVVDDGAVVEFDLVGFDFQELA